MYDARNTRYSLSWHEHACLPGSASMYYITTRGGCSPPNFPTINCHRKCMSRKPNLKIEFTLLHRHLVFLVQKAVTDRTKESI